MEKEIKLDHYLELGRNFDRLTSEYDKYGSLTIGFDFDSTVHDHYKTGESYEMVRQLLRDLKEINCILICWTCNPDHEYVGNFLKENNIPFDGINVNGVDLPWQTRKPFFNALLDDRAGLQQVYVELNSVYAYVKMNEYDKGDTSTEQDIKEV